MTETKQTRVQYLFRIALAVMMLMAGLGHLTLFRQAFQAQVPRFLPQDPVFMDAVVIVSGLIEIGWGLALIYPGKHRVRIGVGLAVFFLLIFPGNLSQYVHGIDAFGLDTDRKRLLRLFFQPVLILWALWCTGAGAYLWKKNLPDS